MKKISFLVILLLLVFTSCKTKTIEIIEQTYPDGSPKIVKTYIEKNQERTLVKEIQYYPNHNKFIEGEYKNNRKHGKWIAYYENGKKWSEGFFADGLDDGKRTTYFENGKIRFIGFYKKGVETGLWKFYDETGKLVEEKRY